MGELMDSYIYKRHKRGEKRNPNDGGFGLGSLLPFPPLIMIILIISAPPSNQCRQLIEIS